MDRRAAFFAIAAVVCFVLVPIADAGHRYVAVATGLVYVVLAVASYLDRRSRSNVPPRRTRTDLPEARQEAYEQEP